MISPEIRNVARVLASTHRRYPDALPDVLPLFAGIVLITHRELITHLLNTEPDWPWQPQQKQPSGSSSSRG
jgi:hypothetical protein